MNYKYLWFDLDNTLLNFHASSKVSFRQMMESWNLDGDLAAYKAYSVFNKKCWSDYEQGIIDQRTLKKIRFQQYFDSIGHDFNGLEANMIYLQGIIDNPVPIDGAESLLAFANKNGYICDVITNGMKEAQRPRISKINWNQHFRHIFVSDEIGVAKPQTRFFEHCLKAAGAPPKDEILVIGDSIETDILGAKNYGVTSCWMNPSRKVNPPDIIPDYEITTLDELYDII